MSKDAFDRIARLDLWTAHVDITPLPGGITNRNFLVAERGGGRYVARLGEDIPVHGVMRFNELAAARAAHAAGLSPEVVHAEPGIMVSRFVDGRPLDAAAVRSVANRDRIVDLIRRCHTELPKLLRGPSLVFWPFQAIRIYLGVLAEERHRLRPELPRLASITADLEAAVGPVHLAFGHNDLLAGNILDDGERLWLIDWDYAGFNTPLFDLANLSSNNDFDETDDAWLLVAYFGVRATAAQCRPMLAMKAVSLLREALWSAVSETRSTIDFDYAGYTRAGLDRFEAALDVFLASDPAEDP